MLFVCFFNGSIWSNGFKPKEGCFRLDVRNKFFTMGVVNHGHGLLREVIDASSLGIFKVRLEDVLSNLI